MTTPKHDHDREVKELLSNLQWQTQRVERMILATPTSPRRNSLCDASIHLAAAMLCLTESQQNAPQGAQPANPT